MPWYLVFYFFFRTNGKNEHLDENEFRHGYGNYYLISAISKFFLNSYEVHYQRHLEDTLYLKIFQIYINIRANSFLDKYHEAKMQKGA